MYEREGVDWAHVDFDDNQACVDLLDVRPPRGVGVLSLLDEECLFPRATDASFGDKLRAQLGSAPHFGCPPAGHGFTVRHYAGDVAYSVERFLDKNRDTLSPGARLPCI